MGNVLAGFTMDKEAGKRGELKGNKEFRIVLNI